VVPPLGIGGIVVQTNGKLQTADEQFFPSSPKVEEHILLMHASPGEHPGGERTLQYAFC
jgi:hypothetical protein